MWQKVVVVGNVGRDPESVQTKSDRPLTKFSVACNRRWVVDGERREDTEWFTVVCFGRMAEVAAQMLGRGSLVLVEGRLQTRSWESDGVKQYRTELICQSFQKLGGDRARSRTAPHPAATGNGGVLDSAPDEIPF